MFESAILLMRSEQDPSKQEILYHYQPRYSPVFIPDSDVVWEQIWNHRAKLIGTAHSHPGGGILFPSFTDLETYDAIELALGKRLEHWIINDFYTIRLIWKGPDRYDYCCSVEQREMSWIGELKKMSEYHLPQYSIPSE